MPMCHRAFPFDWRAFTSDELPGLLAGALETGDTAGLAAYVERNRSLLRDPYEGDPLGGDWQDLLENRDAHEFGDFALTRFYDPAADGGLGYGWAAIDDGLAGDERRALLGSPFGPADNRFDPGRYGSYFQTPEEVAGSLDRVRRLDAPGRSAGQAADRGRYAGLLAECVSRGLGLYVTF